MGIHGRRSLALMLLAFLISGCTVVSVGNKSTQTTSGSPPILKVSGLEVNRVGVQSMSGTSGAVSLKMTVKLGGVGVGAQKL